MVKHLLVRRTLVAAVCLAGVVSVAAFAQGTAISDWGTLNLATINPTQFQADGVVSSAVGGLFRTYSCTECAAFPSDSGSSYGAINEGAVTLTFVDPGSGDPVTASNVSVYIADDVASSGIRTFTDGVEGPGCVNVFSGCPYAQVRVAGKSVDVMFPGPISQLQFVDDTDGHVIDDLRFDLNLDPETKADCKNGGWAAYGFRNQGQCIRFVNTGKDSRG